MGDDQVLDLVELEVEIDEGHKADTGAFAAAAVSSRSSGLGGLQGCDDKVLDLVVQVVEIEEGHPDDAGAAAT